MTNDYLSLLSAILLAAASGMVGVFALMRRMSLAADAISHIALPGLGLAILWGISPLIGGAVSLFLGALIIWNIENRTAIPTETIIGAIFSISLALGALFTPQEDLIEALFGGGANEPSTLILIAALSLLIIAAIWTLKNKFIIQMISADLAGVTGLKNKRLSLYFLLLFALTVILGLKFLGALLMGSLIIIPAAASRNLGWNMNSMILIAVLIAVFSVILGTILSSHYQLSLGPTTIVLSGLAFLTSLFLKK